MGVTQYVGARYVPLFADPAEWDKTKVYEPLTIVLYQGNSYTSRQTVPVGIDINNEEFWVLTGNYNAQVEQYRKDVVRFSKQVVAEIARAEAAEKTLDTKIDTKIDTVESELAQNISETADKITEGYKAADDALNKANTAAITAETSRAKAAESANAQSILDISGSVASMVGSVPIFVTSTSAMTDTSKVYVLTTNSHIYTYVNSAWTDSGVTYAQQSDVVQTKLYVSANSLTLADANSAPDNSVVEFNYAGGSSDICSNLPYSEWPKTGSSLAIMKTFKPSATSYKVQEFHRDGEIWVRTFTTKWEVWRRKEFIVDCYSSAGATYVTSADDAANNSVVMFNYGGGATLPTNLPYKTQPNYGSSLSLLFTYKPENTSFKVQEYHRDGEIWVRTFTTKWEMWRQSTDTIVHVSDLTTLLDLLSVNTYRNIYVEAGTYDFVKTLGESFFDNATSSISHGYPIRGKMICSPNAKFVCNYKGSNEFAQNLFSPFNLTDDSCEIVGMNIEVSGVRYCLHDDIGSSESSRTYVHKFINCKFVNNNDTSTMKGYEQCIGGGFGRSANVVIDGCTFESANAKAEKHTDARGIVSYHNTGASNGRSTLTVKNCYFKDNGTVRVSWYGNSTEVSTCIVTNNNVGKEPFSRAETTASTVQNVELLAWNNVVRG